MLLKIDHIRLDGNTQPRVAIHEPTVTEYRDAYLAGDELPAPVVFFDGAHHWLADGYHRIHGARAANTDALECDVRNGTRRDAVLFSVGANAKHGLRRSPEDKRKAVDTLLADEEWQQWSNNAIAKACHVSVDLVAKRRDSLSEPKVTTGPASLPGTESEPAAKPERQERTYTTKHGTQATMNVANIGRKKAEKPAKAAPQAEERDPDLGESADTLLQDMQRDIERQAAELKVCEADDLKAEALKWRRAYDHAQSEQSAAMTRANESREREAWAVRQLRRCGKAVGEDDPSRIAASVEAFVRQHKPAEKPAKVKA